MGVGLKSRTRKFTSQQKGGMPGYWRGGTSEAEISLRLPLSQAISRQPSAISYQPSAISYQLCECVVWGIECGHIKPIYRRNNRVALISILDAMRAFGRPAAVCGLKFEESESSKTNTQIGITKKK